MDKFNTSDGLNIKEKERMYIMNDRFTRIVHQYVESLLNVINVAHIKYN